MVITPAQPDNLGGSTYTFGITDLSGASVDYNLVSDLCFAPIAFPVQSAQVQLVADTGSGLTYYLALSDGTDPGTAQVVLRPGPSLAAQHIFFARAGGGAGTPAGGSAARLTRPGRSCPPGLEGAGLAVYIYASGPSRLGSLSSLFLFSRVRTHTGIADDADFGRSAWLCLPEDRGQKKQERKSLHGQVGGYGNQKRGTSVRGAPGCATYSTPGNLNSRAGGHHPQGDHWRLQHTFRASTRASLPLLSAIVILPKSVGERLKCTSRMRGFRLGFDPRIPNHGTSSAPGNRSNVPTQPSYVMIGAASDQGRLHFFIVLLSSSSPAALTLRATVNGFL